MATFPRHPQGRPEEIIKVRHSLSLKALLKGLVSARLDSRSEHGINRQAWEWCVATSCPISHCLCSFHALKGKGSRSLFHNKRNGGADRSAPPREETVLCARYLTGEEKFDSPSSTWAHAQ